MVGDEGSPSSPSVRGGRLLGWGGRQGNVPGHQVLCGAPAVPHSGCMHTRQFLKMLSKIIKNFVSSQAFLSLTTFIENILIFTTSNAYTKIIFFRMNLILLQ